MSNDKTDSIQAAPKETDYLKYTGNSVPRVIRIAWTVLIIFSILYLVKYMWPDLVYWLAK